MTNSHRNRLTQDRNVRVKLTQRDHEIIFTLFLLKTMKRGHIQAIHFGSVPRCNQRLRALYDARFLDRYDEPAGSTAETIYCLGRKALPLLAALCEQQELHLSTYDLARQAKHPKRGLLSHTLSISDVYVAFSEGLKGSRLTLTGFLPEIMCRQEFEVRRTGSHDTGESAWRQITVAPDGCLIIKDSSLGLEYALLLEADLGDTGKQMVSKLHGYSQMIKSGLAYEIVGHDRISLLLVTTGRRRARNLVEIARQENMGYVWSTSFPEMLSKGPLAQIWQHSADDGIADLGELIRKWAP